MFTLKELRAIANEYKIEGRSYLDKQSLMRIIQDISPMKSMSIGTFRLLRKGDIIPIWQSHLFGEVLEKKGDYSRFLMTDVDFRKIQGDFNLNDYVGGRYIISAKLWYFEDYFYRAGRMISNGEL